MDIIRTDQIDLRNAMDADVAAITQIYAWHVEHGLCSFEEVPPSVEEMGRRLAVVRARGLPWYVASVDGRIAGYCYATPYSSRSAYRFTVQESIYIDETLVGKGVGKLLLAATINECRRLGYWQMLAVIGDSGDEATLRLHTRQGFRYVGQAIQVGFKLGRWIDIVLMQKSLQEVPAILPKGNPLGYVPLAGNEQD